uniref:Uncharacterized protein n=1 Tax=Oryza rufipogon TaxID=4529 RepID=A0A0E0MS04_ORYRU
MGGDNLGTGLEEIALIPQKRSELLAHTKNSTVNLFERSRNGKSPETRRKMMTMGQISIKIHAW